jgi:hypothetical protein
MRQSSCSMDAAPRALDLESTWKKDRTRRRIQNLNVCVNLGDIQSLRTSDLL